MIDLAQQDTEDYIPLKDIAERQDISKKYLEMISNYQLKQHFIYFLDKH